jgi:hypothetical protein
MLQVRGKTPGAVSVVYSTALPNESDVTCYHSAFDILAEQPISSQTFSISLIRVTWYSETFSNLLTEHTQTRTSEYINNGVLHGLLQSFAEHPFLDAYLT